jgi:starvation-inducible DNA-binding protein
MLGETCRVDRRRGDDELEIAPFREQALEIAQQKVDVEAALVRLVEDDRVVRRQPRIALRFGEQDAVGHELDQRVLAALIGKAHLETDEVADLRAEFLGDAARDRARGDAAGLRAADHSRRTASGGEAELGQLRRLARPGFSGQHDDLMLADQLDDLVAARGDRQRFIDADVRHALGARGDACARGIDRGAQRGEVFVARFFLVRRQPLPAAEQTAAVAREHAVERAGKVGQVGHRRWKRVDKTRERTRFSRANGDNCGLSPRFASSIFAEVGRLLKSTRPFPSERPMAIDIGITKKDRETIAKNLSRLLADTYSLYLKTHSFHWNVTGTMFNTLHLMFETQYNALWTAADVIAERIRALDVYAPGSYTQFGKLTAIAEETGVPDWKSMVQQLVDGHETVARTARDVFKAADKADDQPTADLATQRMQEHEKTAWMLRSLLK